MATASTKVPYREENNQMSGKGTKAQRTLLGPAVGNTSGNPKKGGGINRAVNGKGAAE